MSCAYLYVYNLLAVNVSGFRRKNLAFDKETVVDGRGLTAKGAKDAKGGLGNPPSPSGLWRAGDKRRKAKPPQGRRARRNWVARPATGGQASPLRPFDTLRVALSRSTMLTALSPSKGMVEGRQAQGYGGQDGGQADRVAGNA